MRNAHIRDAAALIQFFAWLEESLVKAVPNLTECSVSDRLEVFRAAQKDFVSLSFETIAGSGPNGAIIHYKPERNTCAQVGIDKMFLCDSGGQYKDGTTDVTRTLHFGRPTAREIKCYTHVLQGHLALSQVIFPEGSVPGYALDILARMHLWDQGLDYQHGTGHGVGAFLNVHEGPQGISRRYVPDAPALAVGMTTSNEPGYYEDGNFGIRIENVMVVEKAQTNSNNGSYLGFETLTMVPYETRLIDVSLLSDRDLNFVNQYHKKCLEKVGPLLQNDERALYWLQLSTKPLAR